MGAAGYRRLVAATGIEGMGSGACVAAVPLLAITITRDPRLVTAISTMAYLPWLLVALPAGTWVDRFDRAGLMWRTQLVAAAIVAATGILAALDGIGIATLAVLAFALGICTVVLGVAVQTVLPDVVPGPMLHRANGAQQAVITAGHQFAGPPLGSALFAVSAGLPFAVTAGSFAVAAFLLSGLPKTGRRERKPVRTAVAEGLRWLTRHRLLRTVAVLLGVNTFFGQLANATLVLFATQTLQVSAGGYGLLLTAAGAGSVLSGLISAHVPLRAGSSLVVAAALNVVALVGAGFSPGPVTLGCFLALGGFATTMWNVATATLRQRLVPSTLLGRVNSVYKLLGWGLIPLGMLAGGLVAHGLGLRVPYQLAGVARAVALAVALPALLRHGRAG
ncbi:MFS transporter [Amycolatopsis suaedae]|uniref:MFS transporter n=1 Tax=Amycolatopsis suaedae TaxID=2510978 RepID=A0A4Q7J1X4_9PSEU|nr:MFS transporter [Amycolatopsis suaedae]RZQ61420.1 MFS transporter [Amycolatopsis suaedae]